MLQVDHCDGVTLPPTAATMVVGQNVRTVCRRYPILLRGRLVCRRLAYGGRHQSRASA